MIRFNTYLLCGLVITGIWSCKEEDPGIDFSKPCDGLFDSTYVTGSPAPVDPKVDRCALPYMPGGYRNIQESDIKAS